MRRSSITDIICGHLEEGIFTGKFKPGSKITEEQVAASLDISRPPVREAFKLLEAEGLIVRQPRRGVFVANVTDQDAWEIYTLKAELYAFSIRLSFRRITDSDLNRMGRLINAMEECVRTDPPSILSYQELNASFHDVHVDAAGHQRLKRMLQTLHNQLRYFSYQTLSNREHLEESCRCHRKIHEVFQLGDQEAAIKLSREHVFAGLREFRRLHASQEMPPERTLLDSAAANTSQATIAATEKGPAV